MTKKRVLTGGKPQKTTLVKLDVSEIKRKLRPVEAQLTDLNTRESYAINLMGSVCQRIISLQKLLDIAPKSPYQDIAGAYRDQIESLTREACSIKVHIEALYGEMGKTRATALAILEGKDE